MVLPNLKKLRKHAKLLVANGTMCSRVTRRSLMEQRGKAHLIAKEAYALGLTKSLPRRMIDYAGEIPPCANGALGQQSGDYKVAEMNLIF